MNGSPNGTFQVLKWVGPSVLAMLLGATPGGIALLQNSQYATRDELYSFVGEHTPRS